MPPPAFGLRALPGVHQRDARRARRMRLHGRRRRQRMRLECPAPSRPCRDSPADDVADDERPADRTSARRFERLLGHLDVGVLAAR